MDKDVGEHPESGDLLAILQFHNRPLCSAEDRDVAVYLNAHIVGVNGQDGTVHGCGSFEELGLAYDLTSSVAKLEIVGKKGGKRFGVLVLQRVEELAFYTDDLLFVG